MREAFRGGWPFSHPPNLDFDLNWRSPQADGLVFWLPLGVSRSIGASHRDRVRGTLLAEGGTPTWIVDGDRGWSMLFDDAATEYLHSSITPVTAVPLTLSAWAYNDALDSLDTAFGIFDASSQDWFRIGVRGHVDNSVVAQTQSTGPGGANSSTFMSVNTWHHICGAFYATDSRAAFLDGGGKGTDATDLTPVSLDVVIAGRRSQFGGGQEYWSGGLSDTRIYNRALSDAEVFEQYRNPWELFMPRVRLWPGFADDGCVTTVTVTETATVTVVAQQ